MFETPITFEVALQIVNTAMMSKESRHLKNIEIEVLRGVLQGHKYDEIAATSGYAPEYIKNDVGPKLWQTLSSIWKEKVCKNNLMAVLAQQAFQVTIMPQTKGEEAKYHPSPSTKSELPIGVIPSNSNFYLERQGVESCCYAEIMKPGALIQIKAPHQMGKTSLMLRILDYARQQNSPTVGREVRTVALSLQRADKATFSDLDSFLRWFCSTITRKLQLPHRIDDYWDETCGSKNNCTAYFENYLLPTVSGTLVLALDKVDEVFLYPEIAKDFFSLLHSWHEEANYGDSGNHIWQNLQLVIVHSEEVYDPLNVNESLNAGLIIDLKAFTSEQVQYLAQCYELQLSSGELSELMELVAGHPYLVQQTFYHLIQQELTLNQLVQIAATDAGIYCYHLHRKLRSLQHYPQLAAAYYQVVNAPTSIELEQPLAFKLCNMGLATLQGNKISPSCELYRRYFRHWSQTNSDKTKDNVSVGKHLSLVSGTMKQPIRQMIELPQKS